MRECGVCWWVYDPEAGDADALVPPGVAFDALPDTYVCPRCGASKARFLRPASALDSLVEAYRAADTRMRGLPIYHHALAVEPIGFRTHGSFEVGALVTPWLLSIVVLGADVPAAGEEVELTFAGGTFRLRASHQGVPHLALSLFSPVTELANQHAARAVAHECLRLVLDGAAPCTTSRRGIFGGLLGA